MNDREKAFLELIYVHEQGLKRHICCAVSDSHAAEDVFQASLENAWRAFHQIKDRRKAKAWLFTIADNEIKAYYRKKVAEYQSADIDGTGLAAFEKQDEVLSELLREENAEVLKRAIRGLDEKYKIILILYYMEEKTTKEIAEITGINHNTVRVYIGRGLIKLKDAYEKLTQESADEKSRMQ